MEYNSERFILARTLDAKFCWINIETLEAIVDSAKKWIHLHICLLLEIWQRHLSICIFYLFIYYLFVCFADEINPHIKLKVSLKVNENPPWCGSECRSVCGDGGVGLGHVNSVGGGGGAECLLRGFQPAPLDTQYCTAAPTSERQKTLMEQRPSRSAQHLLLQLQTEPLVVSRHDILKFPPSSSAEEYKATPPESCASIQDIERQRSGIKFKVWGKREGGIWGGGTWRQ